MSVQVNSVVLSSSVATSVDGISIDGSYAPTLRSTTMTLRVLTPSGQVIEYEVVGRTGEIRSGQLDDDVRRDLKRLAEDAAALAAQYPVEEES